MLNYIHLGQFPETSPRSYKRVIWTPYRQSVGMHSREKLEPQEPQVFLVKIFYIRSYLSIDSALLSGLEQLKEFHLDDCGWLSESSSNKRNDMIGLIWRSITVASFWMAQRVHRFIKNSSFIWLRNRPDWPMRYRFAEVFLMRQSNMLLQNRWWTSSGRRTISGISQ